MLESGRHYTETADTGEAKVGYGTLMLWGGSREETGTVSSSLDSSPFHPSVVWSVSLLIFLASTLISIYLFFLPRH